MPTLVSMSFLGEVGAATCGTLGVVVEVVAVVRDELVVIEDRCGLRDVSVDIFRRRRCCCVSVGNKDGSVNARSVDKVADARQATESNADKGRGEGEGSGL